MKEDNDMENGADSTMEISNMPPPVQEDKPPQTEIEGDFLKTIF